MAFGVAESSVGAIVLLRCKTRDSVRGAGKRRLWQPALYSASPNCTVRNAKVFIQTAMLKNCSHPQAKLCLCYIPATTHEICQLLPSRRLLATRSLNPRSAPDYICPIHVTAISCSRLTLYSGQLSFYEQAAQDLLPHNSCLKIVIRFAFFVDNTL